VNKLIAQNVQPVEDETQGTRAVTSLERLGRSFESIFLVFESVDSVVMLPEGTEDISVFHEHE
jgi:hypothetical protein